MGYNLYEQMVSETIKMLFSSVFMFVVQFVFTILLARIYSPDEFGVLSKITVITSFADVFCQMGLGQAVVQKKQRTEQDYKTVAFTSVLLGAFNTLVVILFSIPISDLVKIDNTIF